MYEGMQGMGQGEVTPALFDYGAPWWLSPGGSAQPDGSIPGAWNPWYQTGVIGGPVMVDAGGLDIGYRIQTETACPNCAAGETPWGWIALAGIGGFLLASSRRRG